MDPGLGERVAGELVGPGRVEPALGADGAARDRREPPEADPRDPVGQCLAVRARAGRELGSAVPVLAGRGHRLPGGAAPHLEPHRTTDGNRLDRGGEGGVRVVSGGHPATGLDDLWQRRQPDRLRDVRADRHAGDGFADVSVAEPGPATSRRDAGTSRDSALAPRVRSAGMEDISRWSCAVQDREPSTRAIGPARHRRRDRPPPPHGTTPHKCTESARGPPPASGPVVRAHRWT